MKIGINTSFLRKPGTGIGQVTTNFLQKLVEFQISNPPVGLASSNALNPKPSIVLYTEEPIDTRFSEIFMVRSFLPTWWKRDDVIRKLLWEKQLARTAMEDDCDVFISLYQSATVFPEDSGISHTMVVHDIIPKLFPEYLRKISQRLHWNAIEKGIRNADHIVAISESTKKDLMGNLGIADEKISVASIGLSSIFDRVADDAEVDRVMKKYHLNRGYIYHGGGLETRKNTESVFRAYATLCVENQESRIPARPNGGKNQEKIELPKLIISGKIFDKKNPLATDVLGLISELGLIDQVKLLGFVPDEDLPALYRGAALFVYPSLYEGFGLPPLEAMSQGTPVIVSNVSSLPEICGDSALFVDPMDTNMISEKMLVLLCDAEMRRDMSEKGLLRVKKFNWDNFMTSVMR